MYVRNLFALCHSLCSNGFAQSTRDESLKHSYQLEKQRDCSWESRQETEGKIVYLGSLEGPHQHWRMVLTELNWVKESNSWNIKPG